jgi:hypothetical protein
MDVRIIENIKIGLKSSINLILNFEYEAKTSHMNNIRLTMHIGNLVRFINGQPLIANILIQLRQKKSDEISNILKYILNANISEIISKQRLLESEFMNEGIYNQIFTIYDQREEHVLLSWEILQYISVFGRNEIVRELMKVCCNSLTLWNTKDCFYESIEFLKHFMINPLNNYIEEYLDSMNLTSYLLTQYKQRTEWFNSEALQDIIRKENERKKEAKSKDVDVKRQYEKKLILDIYKYLFDSGIEFYIEPNSMNGEVDFITKKGKFRIICDAKVYSTKQISKLNGSFNQVYDYLDRYNEDTGYVLIYNIAEKERLKFEFDGFVEDFAFLELNNKRVYFLEIWLNKTEMKSSKMQFKEVVVKVKDVKKE